ncbi:MAG TPA: AMP-binding protein [Solirubrobacterales bacterium]|nr:AMP-binding protein [Solirubrobacterales bacterium]
MSPSAEQLLARPDTRLTSELAATYAEEGGWRGVPLSDYLHGAAAATPEATAVVGFGGEDGRDRVALTYAELEALVDRLRGGLAGLGVGPGDVVSIMLPNGPEFAALIWAVLGLGAVYSGIPASYGEREASFMVRRAKAKVLVVPWSYRDRGGYVELARAAQGASETLEHVVLVDGPETAGTVPYETLATAAPAERTEVDAGALAHIGFTSGTTGEPKGVMNSHETLDAVLVRWFEHVGEEALGPDAVNLVASPVGHHTGFLWGVLWTTYRRGAAVFMDRWSPSRAAEIMREEGVTVMFGAPTFLQDLVNTPAASAEATATLRAVVVAGAPIPRTLPDEGRARFGCFVCPAWGMTEYGIGVSAAPSLDQARVAETDGHPVRGCEVRVLAEDGTPAAPGEEGELQMTGPGLFLGYFDRPDFTAEAFDGAWFKTGDRATLEADGLLTLQGRSKDIVIRGGENIPVIEIESLLYAHPDVIDAAVVGLPDERLGERACAILVTGGGAKPELAELCDYLLGEGLSRHFLPERLELMEALPKTASGKIRKNELRDLLSE